MNSVYTKDQLEKIAIENLNEDPKRLEADIKSIKDWIKKQPHLKDNGRNGKFRENNLTILNLNNNIV